MRIAPRPLIIVGVALGYMAIVVTMWSLLGLDHDEVGDSTSTVVKGIVLPVAGGAVFLAVATSYLGWWRPAIREELRAPNGCGRSPCSWSSPGSGS
ncbi:MAG: hypothetical protein ACXWDM_14550 [Nocardioides sp.]